MAIDNLKKVEKVEFRGYLDIDWLKGVIDNIDEAKEKMPIITFQNEYGYIKNFDGALNEPDKIFDELSIVSVDNPLAIVPSINFMIERDISNPNNEVGKIIFRTPAYFCYSISPDGNLDTVLFEKQANTRKKYLHQDGYYPTINLSNNFYARRFALGYLATIGLIDVQKNINLFFENRLNVIAASKNDYPLLFSLIEASNSENLDTFNTIVIPNKESDETKFYGFEYHPSPKMWSKFMGIGSSYEFLNAKSVKHLINSFEKDLQEKYPSNFAKRVLTIVKSMKENNNNILGVVENLKSFNQIKQEDYDIVKSFKDMDVDSFKTEIVEVGDSEVDKKNKNVERLLGI